MASLPMRSMRLTWPSRLTRTQGQLSRDGHLLDVARLAGAVPALHHHAAVVHEAGEQRQRRVAIEDVVGVERRHVLVGAREGRHLQVGVDLEQLARRPHDIGKMQGSRVHGSRKYCIAGPEGVGAMHGLTR